MLLQDAVYLLNQKPLNDTVSPKGRIHRSGNQEVEAGMASLTITPTDPQKFHAFISVTLGSAGSKVQVPKEDALLPGDISRVSLNYKLQLLPRHFGFLGSREQQMRRGVTILSGLSNPS